MLQMSLDEKHRTEWIRWWRSMLHPVFSAAMKQLWGEGNYHTEFDDMMKEKAVMKGTKIMNVLEVLKEPSVYPQLSTMLLLLLSLQLCGLSAAEYTLFPCLHLLLSNRSATIPSWHFPLDLYYSFSHRAHCPQSSVVSSLLFFKPFRELLGWKDKRFSSAELPTRALLPSFPWWYYQRLCRIKGYKYPKACYNPEIYLSRLPSPPSLTSAVADGQLLPPNFHSIW